MFIAALCVSAAQKPNIVVVMADDIGVGDISYYNREIRGKKPVFQTPNIDEIAASGTWFTDGHSATALCSPTRYAIMSGKNNYRSYAPWGVWGMFRKNAISNEEPTLGNVVQQQGYATAFVGKWHLGGDFNVPNSNKVFRGQKPKTQQQVDVSEFVAGGAKDLGFDYSFMLPDGIQGPEYLVYENDQWFPLDKDSEIQYIDNSNVYDKKMISDKGAGLSDSHWRTEAIGDLISQKAADFIYQQKSAQPLMLYYASPMAHLPHMPPKEFDGIAVAGTTGSAHMDMIKEMDLQVGRIITALKKTGRYDNTLFIFTSDNGGLMWGVPGTKESGHEISGIYRGSKNWAHEGGHRVPFIVSWPGKIKPKSFSDEQVLVQDILATISAAAGNPLNQTQAPDSNNLLPLLLDKQGFKPREYLMLQGGSKHQVIYREGDWKLIMQSDRKATKFEPTDLFNLKDNVVEDEGQNLIKSTKHQDKVQQMLKRYLTIRQSGQPTAW